MKTSRKIVIISIIIVSIGGGIITAELLKEPVPYHVETLRNMIELFDGVQYYIQSDNNKYTIGENIVVTSTLINYNNSNITIFCEGIINQTTLVPYTSYEYKIYDKNYSLIWFDTIGSTDNATNPIYTGLFGTYNFTLAPSQTTQCILQWKQTYGAFQTPELLGKQVPPGKYRIVGQLLVAWWHYYGECYPLRNYGAMTEVTIEPND